MKILLCGYIGGGNCGDEAICDRLVGILKTAGDKVTLLSLNPMESAVLHSSPALPRYSPATLRAIIECDLLILGGGTLLQEDSSHRSALYYLGMAALASLMGKPWVLMGGIDPLYGVNRRLATGILPNARAFLLRSKADLERIAPLAPHVPRFYVPDTALLPLDISHPFEPPDTRPSLHAPHSHTPPPPYILVCPKRGVPRSLLTPPIAHARKQGRSVVWLALSREDEGVCAMWADVFGGVWVAPMPQADSPLSIHFSTRPLAPFPTHRRVEASAILSGLGEGIAHRYFSASPCEVACRLIEGAEIVYSARLHGLLFAQKTGTPARILSDGTGQWKFAAYLERAQRGLCNREVF